MFFSHLDKEPRYSIPQAPKYAPQEVENLLPSISEVHVHHHGDQAAIVMEGTNLWFCREVFLLGHKQNVLSGISSGSSIHVNVFGKKLKIADSGKRNIPVIIYSPFSSKPIKRDSVPLYTKVNINFYITLHLTQYNGDAGFWHNNKTGAVGKTLSIQSH